MAQNLYDCLGVARDADTETIRTAYRKLARQFHPDVNPGDDEAEERFKEISQAYSVLSDTDKKRDYDEFGEVSLEGGFDADAARKAQQAFHGRHTNGGDPGLGGEFHFGDLDDLFGGIFTRFGRGEARAPRPRRGMDLESSITLDFLDAARGGEQRISVGRPSADGTAKQDNLTVRVPPGVADGGRIRLQGKGGESPDGPPGDLYLTVRVRPHPVFRREGRDLHIDLPVTFHEATLGAKVELPTLEGRATVTVPAGTHSGKKLRLRGKGVPTPSGGTTGDLIATVQIRVPEKLSEEERRTVEALEAVEAKDLREGLFR